MVRSYGDMIEPAISAERLARAWPLLEQLCIQGTYSHSIAPLWSLQDLYAFAIFTPRLRHLTIDFDATNMTAPSFPPLHIPQMQLTHLEILCFSPIGDPDTVASILSDAFPSLHTVMLSELRVMFYDLPYEMDRYNKKWERVAKLLSGSARVRR
ncbi:hypothetical protein K525DRAFT_205695 [Schizophyllum commune Loenen D]|nr:hypothetical protein K525DRAFT_205695 [Schizophyllum commune Loenen D]